MKYLFIDIEACDGSWGLCEFGYVYTNEKFEILKKDLILVNPQKKFKLTGRKKHSNLVLAFKEEEYQDAPIFREVYKEIKEILEEKDLIVFGYSILNDIEFLRKACNRYHLDDFNFNAFDIQKFVFYYDSKRQRLKSLNSTISELVNKEIDSNLILHKSSDDAHLSMLVLREILKNLEMSLGEIIEICEDSKVDSIEYIKERNFIIKDRLEHPEKYRKIKSKSESVKMWNKFYKENHKKIEGENTKGRVVIVSGQIKKDLSILTKVLNKMEEEDLIPYNLVYGSDYFVVLDEKDIERLKSYFAYPYDGEYIIYDEFLKKKFK